MTMKTHYWALGGGMDLVTPAITKPEGRVIAGLNYEPRPEGYRRIDGFERYDGRPQPHKAGFWFLNFTAGTEEIVDGDVVTGATSGATGKVLFNGVVSSGTYAGNDAVGFIVLTAVVGTFVDTENLQVSAATRAVADGVALENGASTESERSFWQEDATETARALIGPAPGSGMIRGVYRYKGKSYAFRDNAGATECLMYVESPTGWIECDKGSTLAFDTGTTAFIEGETVSGGTSGATGLIKRVIVTTGDFSTDDAAGYLVIYSVTGTFQAAEAITSTSGTALATGAQVATTLSPGGRFDFVTYNFYGSANTKRMYGVDGVSRGFEWDGSVFVPIITGMVNDTPTHLAVHKKHLFYAFDGGSVQHSGIGSPYNWTLLLGAGEIGIGDEVTGFVAAVSGILVIYSQNTTDILYGNSSADWNLVPISDEAGAYEWSMQNVGSKFIHSDGNGIRDIAATQAYGDFLFGALSFFVEPLLTKARLRNATLSATVRVKSTNQYRIYRDDGTGLIMDLTTGNPQFLPIDYGKVVRCACSVEDADKTEYVLFGSDDGYIYRSDVGTSFDGEDLIHYLRFPFNNLRKPTHKKRFALATVELEAGPTTNLKVSAEFSYGAPNLPAQIEKSFEIQGGGGLWGEAFWGEFYWSSQIEGIAKADIYGQGTNISLVIAGSGTTEQSHTLHGITLHYSDRGLQR